MSRQRYSIKEAINRILLSLQGKDVPQDDPNTVPGEVLSVNEAASDLAELLAGGLPGETLTLPTSVTSALPTASETVSGIAELATVAEAEAGTDTARIVTPAGVLASINANVAGTVEYGEIYNNQTGTATVELSTSWQKVTGSFQGATLSSDDIVPDFANDLITINKVGIYFVGLMLSFSGTGNNTYNIAAYVDGVRSESVRFRRKLGVGGDVGSAATLGIINVTGTPVNLEMYAMADSGTPNLSIESGQVFIYGIDQE